VADVTVLASIDGASSAWLPRCLGLGRFPRSLSPEPPIAIAVVVLHAEAHGEMGLLATILSADRVTSFPKRLRFGGDLVGS
jgi:hypothetical protein